MSLVPLWDSDIGSSTDNLPEIFSGFSPSEITRVMRCLGVRRRAFSPGEILAREGDISHAVVLLLQGTALVRRGDAEGNRHLIEVITASDVFGEEILWDPARRCQHTATATEQGVALMIDMQKILDPQGPLCELRSRVVENLLRIMGAKNRKLQEHLQVLAHKSLRARLLEFFTQHAAANQSTIFTLRLNRNEMAEHLNADRAALSRELSRMKAEGLIDYHRNSFQLLR